MRRLEINKEVKNDTNNKSVLKYVLFVAMLFILLWVNYCHFSKHISSNPERINNFIAKEDDVDKFRVPAVAGLFYSANAGDLDLQVGQYLTNTTVAHNKQPKILVVPHAGYMYSAQTAAKAYALLSPYKDTIHNVVLVGPSHHVALKGFALSNDDYFTTPLGKIAVNKVMNAELEVKQGFMYNNAAHLKEHSIEVQLPFLQKVLKNFSIIPIVYGEANPQELAVALEPFLKQPNTLIIFSADLSHYYTYDQAKLIDNQTKALVENKLPMVEDHMSCGATGINAAVILSQQSHLLPKLLDIVNSGDVSGDKSGVVGYGAWSFDAPEILVKKTPQNALNQEVENLRSFASHYGKELMNIAKISLEEAVLKNKHFKPSRDDYPDVLFNKGAAFVTLEENNELRGCIGSLLPSQSIADDIALNSYAAAMEDNRFSPVKPEEIKDIKISISLLSGFEPIAYSSEEDLLKKIVKGVDGIIIRDGDRQGVFLPSVWKQLPEPQEFLNNLKLKAGMSPSYWSNKIKVYRFRVVEISKDEN